MLKIPVLPKLCNNNFCLGLNGQLFFSVNMLRSFEDVIFKSFCSPKLFSFLICKKHC